MCLATHRQQTNYLKHRLPNLIQEEINSSNNPSCIKVIEFIVKNLKMKIPDTDGSISEFYKYLKKKQPTLHHLPQKTEQFFLSDVLRPALP